MKRKQFLSGLLTLTLCLTQLPATTVTVRADDTDGYDADGFCTAYTWDASAGLVRKTDDSGEDCACTGHDPWRCYGYQKPTVNDNGTPDDTYDDYYEISNVGQLCWLAEQDLYACDYNAKLMSDIDLKTAGQYWKPICDEASTYTRTFDGNGHTISGLNVNRTSALEYAGLFGRIGTNGVVKDLTVKGTLSASSSGLNMGAIAGESYGTIEHCTSEVTVTGTSNSSNNAYVGGIVGANNDGSAIKDCVVNASVSASATDDSSYTYAGGIAGENYGTIEHCYLNTTASVTATGSFSYAGGITGSFGAGSIKNCFVGSGITLSSGYSAGGIAALCYNPFGNETTPTIDHCYSLAAIPANNGVNGAIIGEVGEFVTPTATDCYYNSDLGYPPYFEESTGNTTNLTITGVPNADFRSGAVAWKLNGGSSEGIWKQTLGTDNAPAFSGTDSTKDTVYTYTNCAGNTGYSNTENVSSDHSFGTDGVCTICTQQAAAQIKRGNDTIFYLSLADACAAAQDGDTINLQADDSGTGTIYLDKNNLTLDLGPYRIINSRLIVNGGSLTIQNTIRADETSIPELCVNDGTVTLCATGYFNPLFGRIYAKDGVGSLLAEGCVYHKESGDIYYESDTTTTALTDVSVQPAPFTLSEITASTPSCAPGTKVTFSISVDGSWKNSVDYEWSYSTDGGNTWGANKTANTQKSYTDTLQDSGTYQIKCVVTVPGSSYTKTAILDGYTVTAYTISNVSVQQVGSLKYNGSEQKANISATATAENGAEVTFYYSTDEDGPFNSTYVPDLKDAGTHTIYYQVRATNHTTVTGSFPVTIDPLDLSTDVDVKLTGADGEHVYDGNPRSIAVSVKYKDTGYELLASDYTASGKTATDAGTYSVTITGSDNGNCIGSITPTGTDGKPITWTISKKELQTQDLPTITISRAEGSAETQTIDLKKMLEDKYPDAKPSNFTFRSGISEINDDDLHGRIDPDTGILTITHAAYNPTNPTSTFNFRCDSKNYDCKKNQVSGMTNYGYLPLEVSISFVKNLARAEISVSTCTYDGTPQTPAVTITCDGKTLTQDTDYTLSCDAKTDAGTYTLTATGKGDYAGTATQTWSIAPHPLTDAVVTQSGSLTFNGSPQTPAVTVTCDGRTLTQDTDYIINCTPQTDVSDTYTVTVSGKADSNYTGEASGSWAIGKAAAPKLADISVTRSVSASKPTTVNIGSLRALPYQTPATGFTLGTYDDTAMELSLDAASGVLTIVRADGTAGDTLTVPVKIDSTNYKTASVNVVLALSNKTEQALTVTMNGWTAGAAANTPSYTTADGAGAVSVTYMGRGETVYAESTAVPTEAGDYTVCVHYETDSAIYHGTTDFTITKPAGSSGNSGSGGSSGSSSSGSSGSSGGGGGAAGGAPVAPSTPDTDKNKDFVDVPAGSAYYDAVSWAVRMGITDDADATHFHPESTCSGTQVITCLWRAAGSPDAKLPAGQTNATDSAKAMAWAIENGIMSGIGANNTCTRTRAAAALIRYAAANGKDAKALRAYLFSSSDAAELLRSISPLCWSKTTTDRYCTKGQLVQMLYLILSDR